MSLFCLKYIRDPFILFIYPLCTPFFKSCFRDGSLQVIVCKTEGFFLAPFKTSLLSFKQSRFFVLIILTFAGWFINITYLFVLFVCFWVLLRVILSNHKILTSLLINSQNLSFYQGECFLIHSMTGVFTIVIVTYDPLLLYYTSLKTSLY